MSRWRDSNPRRFLAALQVRCCRPLSHIGKLLLFWLVMIQLPFPCQGNALPFELQNNIEHLEGFEPPLFLFPLCRWVPSTNSDHRCIVVFCRSTRTRTGINFTSPLCKSGMLIQLHHRPICTPDRFDSAHPFGHWLLRPACLLSTTGAFVTQMGVEPTNFRV